MYEAVSVLLEIVSAMFQGYCLQYFYGRFLDGRIRNRRINGLAAAVLYGGLRLGMGLILPKGYTSFWVFIRLAVILSIVSMIALVFYRAVGKITLFLGVTFIAVSEMSFFLAHMFFELGNHLLRLWDWCWEKGYISVLQCYDFVINITLIGNQILFHIIGAVLLYFTMRKIVRDYREKDYAIHRTELLYDRYPSLIIIVPVILLLLLLSIVSGVKLFQDMICWTGRYTRWRSLSVLSGTLRVLLCNHFFYFCWQAFS